MCARCFLYMHVCMYVSSSLCVHACLCVVVTVQPCEGLSHFVPTAGSRTSATFRPAERDEVITRGQRRVLPEEFIVGFVCVCVSVCELVTALFMSSLSLSLLHCSRLSVRKGYVLQTTGLFCCCFIFVVQCCYVMCMFFCLLEKVLRTFTYIMVALPPWK